MSACWALAIDWQAVSDGVSGGLQAIAAGVVAICAWKGLEAWRHELRSKRRQELAEEALALSYRVSDAIDHLRGPFAWASELDKVPKQDGESDDSYDRRRHLGVVEVRYAEHSMTFADFLAIRYRVAAVFGVDVKSEMEELVRLSNRVRQAPQSMFSFRQVHERAIRQLEFAAEQERIGNPRTGQKSIADLQAEVDQAAQRIQQFEGVLYKDFGEPDPIAADQKKVIAQLEAKLRSSAQLDSR